jgi:hypothetical protein
MRILNALMPIDRRPEKRFRSSWCAYGARCYFIPFTDRADSPGYRNACRVFPMQSKCGATAILSRGVSVSIRVRGATAIDAF